MLFPTPCLNRKTTVLDVSTNQIGTSTLYILGMKKHVTCHFDHRHNILKKCKNFEKIILSEAACQEKLVTDSLEYLRILNSLNGTFIFVHT